MSEIGNGAQGRNRTTDTVIFSHFFYRITPNVTGRSWTT